MKTVTAAILRNASGHVLLCRRALGQKQAGCWEFPGGKQEEQESLEECLKREMREELGLETKPGRILGESIYRYDHGAIRLIAMECLWIHGEITLTVHDKAEWVPVHQILDFELSPADIPLARTLRTA